MGAYIIASPQNESELYHHGILGMHWGIRRYQPYPDGYHGNGKFLGKLRERHAQRKAEKQFKKKQKVINSYKESGMSNAEAEEAYEKRQRIEKRIKIALGVGLTAAASYVAYKGITNKYVDRVIPEGATLQTMSNIADKMTISPGNGTWDPGNSDFYAAYKGLDKLKYRGLFGNGKAKFEATVKGGMKVASHNSAKKEFLNLINNDSTFKNNVQEAINQPTAKVAMLINHKYRGLNYTRVYNKFMKGNDLSPREQSALYDIFSTVGIINNTAQGQETKRTLYEALKKKGYQAIVDFNDTSSGLRTNHPVVVFDTSKMGKVKQSEYNLNTKDKVLGTATGLIGSTLSDPLNYVAAGVGIPAIVLNKYDSKVRREALARKYDRQHSKKRNNKSNEVEEYTRQRKGGK